jgi:hypothetical protein
MSDEQNISEPDAEDRTDKTETNKQSSKQQSTEQRLQTTNTQLQTIHMETHAHHLHKAPGKKWTHYFFEFLMLFLAVFCGFLAENFREHQVEKEKAKQYIHSLYLDFRFDTGRIQSVIDTETVKIASLSKMSDCYEMIKKNWKDNSCLLELFKFSSANHNIQITDRTIKQLTNAGGFRLLRKQDADSIVNYENEVNDLRDFETTLYQQSQDNVRNTFNDLVEFTANTKLFSHVTINPGAFNDAVELPLLFSDDKILLNKYFNQLFRYLRSIVRHRIYLIEVKQHVTRMIEYFKKEYSLE